MSVNKETQTIDLTPSWVQATNIYRVLIQDGDEKGKAAAWDGIYQMAELADIFAAGVKEGKIKFENGKVT